MEKRHAYLIQAYSRPQQLKVLLGLLDDARNDIFVHLDAKCALQPDDLRDYCRHSALVFTPRIEVNWAGPSIVRSEIILLETALEHGNYAYLHLLSGMDLPVKSQDFIHDFFEKNSGKEYYHYNTGALANHTLLRFQKGPCPEKSAKPAYNLLNNICRFVTFHCGFRRNADVPFRYGSQWFSISGECARYVVDHKAWIENVFEGTFAPDEHFLQTVLAGTRFEMASARENLRHVDFDRSPSVRHPYVFRDADFDELMNCAELFARKFDCNVDNAIIDRICRELKS